MKFFWLRAMAVVLGLALPVVWTGAQATGDSADGAWFSKRFGKTFHLIHKVALEPVIADFSVERSTSGVLIRFMTKPQPVLVGVRRSDIRVEGDQVILKGVSIPALVTSRSADVSFSDKFRRVRGVIRFFETPRDVYSIPDIEAGFKKPVTNVAGLIQLQDKDVKAQLIFEELPTR